MSAVHYLNDRHAINNQFLRYLDIRVHTSTRIVPLEDKIFFIL